MKEYHNFFIPANEHDTFDCEILDANLLHKSNDKVGQKSPISVAICETDKEPESSIYHIHLRIIDGRHRWKTSIKNETKWKVKFYDVKNYHEFMSLRSNFDLTKRKTAREHEEYFANLGKYYEDKLDIPLHKICGEIIKDFQSSFTDATIRRYMPQKYKHMEKANGAYASVKVRHPTSIKDIQEKKPEQIRNDYSLMRHTIKKLQEEIEYWRGVTGNTITYGPFFVLEELQNQQGNRWVVIHTLKDEKIAHEELDRLNTERYRLRKISFNQEIFYPKSSDPRIQRNHKARKYHDLKRKEITA